MTIRLHRGDLPDNFAPGDSVAIDTETLGLNPHRDRLCVVQLSRGDGGLRPGKYSVYWYERTPCSSFKRRPVPPLLPLPPLTFLRHNSSAVS